MASARKVEAEIDRCGQPGRPATEQRRKRRDRQQNAQPDAFRRPATSSRGENRTSVIGRGGSGREDDLGERRLDRLDPDARRDLDVGIVSSTLITLPTRPPPVTTESPFLTAAILVWCSFWRFILRANDEKPEDQAHRHQRHELDQAGGAPAPRTGGQEERLYSWSNPLPLRQCARLATNHRSGNAEVRLAAERFARLKCAAGLRIGPALGRDVAQPGSASHWGCGGRRFEILSSDHFLAVAGRAAEERAPMDVETRQPRRNLPPAAQCPAAVAAEVSTGPPVSLSRFWRFPVFLFLPRWSAG